MKQAVLDRVRVFNKYVTNRVLIHICGKRFGHFAILSHTGRKSGKMYRIPIIAEPVQGGFVIALTYGQQVDWFKNVMAKGGCGLRWKNADYEMAHPRLVEPEAGLSAFPALLRPMLRAAGVKDFVRLEVVKRLNVSVSLVHEKRAAS